MSPGESPRSRGVAIEDFAGRKVTLSAHPQNWRLLTPGSRNAARVVILGPCPGSGLEFPFAHKNARIFCLDSPAMRKRFNQACDFEPRANSGLPWSPVKPEEIQDLARDSQVWFYQPGLRIAPDFWGPILARVESCRLGLSAQRDSANGQRKLAWLPGNSGQLLHLELEEALAKLGFDGVVEGAPGTVEGGGLAALWRKQKPDFVLSVNFRGLDSEGSIFYLCRELEMPLAIWLVDNPWHLLAAIRYPWWREANIFVTDKSFISGLKNAGARNVHFLPLAAGVHTWKEMPIARPQSGPLFVGRACFPGRESFFKGVKLPPDVWEAAQKMLAAGRQLPDYHWWRARMGARLWPGLDGRATGLGADRCSALNRARWLGEGAGRGLRIVGDVSWKEFLPEVPILPPVDYYSGLAELYADAEAVLSVTSLLLPESLNQRHFDVWAAGGLLLSDATKGLDIFPKELTAPMTLNQPADFAGRLAWFGKNQTARLELIHGWRECLANGHFYTDRVKSILETMKN